MAVEWNQARERSVRRWRRILDSIDRRDPIAIVGEINEIAALCEMTRAEAAGPADRCRRCVVFADASYCADIRLDISAFVLNGETDKARAATMAVVERIAAARRPAVH